MRHAPSITSADIVPLKTSPIPRRARKSIFSVIIEALHHSRRLQAERFVRQHRDLIGSAQSNMLREFHSRKEGKRY